MRDYQAFHVWLYSGAIRPDGRQLRPYRKAKRSGVCLRLWKAKPGMPEEIKSRLVHNWQDAHKFWSIWIALFWAAVSGAYVALPAFQSFMSPVAFAFVCIGFSLAICIARLTKQPGLY